MPISKVQSKKSVGDNSVLAFDSNNTLGNLLVILVGGVFTDPPLTFSYSDSLGNIVQALPQRYVTANITSQVFLVFNCKSGPNTVTITPSVNSITALAIHEFTHINILDQNAVATGAGLSQDSGPITTTVADELLFGYEFTVGQTSITPGDLTWTTAETYSTSFLTQYKVVSSIGTYNSTTTATASKSGVVNWIEEIISFYYLPPVTFDGSSTLPAIASQIGAVQMSTFDAAIVIPAVVSAGIAWVPVVGDGSTTLPAVAAAITAQEGQNIAGASTLAKVAAAIAAQEGNNIAGATTLKKVSAVAGGSVSSSPAGAGEPELAGSVNAQTGTTYAIRHSDREHLITFENSAPVAVSIPAATGAFGVGWECYVHNKGAGTVTITPDAGKINEAANIALATGQGFGIVSDDANWQIEGDLT